MSLRKTCWNLCVLTFLALIGITGCQDIQEIFDPDSDEVSLQRKYVINVANKAEDCYYIPNVQINQILNFHFVVSKVDRIL